MARKAAAQVDPDAVPPPEEPPTPTEPVEVEIADEEPVATSEEISVAPEVEPPKPAEESQEDAAIKQRLAEFERANAQLQRQNQELWRQNNVGRQQYANEQWQRFSAQYDAVVNALGAEQSELASAKQTLKTAAAEGDWDAVAEANEKIGTSAGKIQWLTQNKDQMDAWVEQQRNQPPQQRQQPQQPQQQIRQPTEAELRGQAERQISEFQAPERVKTWLRNHMDYMLDPVKNNRLQTLHQMAVEQGLEAYSEPYIQRIEQWLGMRGNGAQNATQSSRQTAPVSAPPTREAPSMTTGRTPQSTRITLSAAEQEIAWETRPDPKMDKQQANKLYAENKRKMQQKKANGELS